MSLNISVIQGRLGKDPELRQTPNGTAVCEISVAVDNGYGDKKSTIWLKVVAWGKSAEFVSKYFKKGGPISITGRLDEERWKDKDSGKDRSRIFITAEKVGFVIGGKSEDGASRDSTPAAAEPAATRSRMTPDIDDGEIPF